jgi:hypothetical protein
MAATNSSVEEAAAVRSAPSADPNGFPQRAAAPSPRSTTRANRRSGLRGGHATGADHRLDQPTADPGVQIRVGAWTLPRIRTFEASTQVVDLLFGQAGGSADASTMSDACGVADAQPRSGRTRLSRRRRRTGFRFVERDQERPAKESRHDCHSHLSTSGGKTSSRPTASERREQSRVQARKDAIALIGGRDDHGYIPD